MVQHFDHYRTVVGKDKIAKQCPDRINKFVVLLKDGTTTEFVERRNAEKCPDSRGMTTVCLNQEEIDVYWSESRRLESEAFDLWYKDLQEDYDYMTPAIFDLCYNKAYEDGHSSGYDEVANYMISITSFAEEILKART